MSTIRVQDRPLVSEPLRMARSLFDSGRYAEAERDCDAVLLAAEGRLRFEGLLLKACVRSETKRYAECLETLGTVGSLVDHAPPAMRAKFYGQRALAHRRMENLDSSLVDYAEARFWAQEAGDELTEATVRNNLAEIYGELGQFDEAINESDAAIALLAEFGNQVYIGRAFDQRAGILIKRGHFAEAIGYSHRAIELLSDHPVAIDARATHAQALIGLAKTYPAQTDPVVDYSVRRAIIKALELKLDGETIQLALERCGNVLQASKALNVSHPTLLTAIKNRKINHSPRRRGKTLIKK